MQHKLESIRLVDSTANPGPLGLLGFGMTTILLNLHNAGYFPMNAMILSMGIFMGGIAQIIAGLMEWKKNNTFGETAFTAYGLFWLSLVSMILMSQLGWSLPVQKNVMGFYLLVWGVFTAFMFVGTFRLSRIMQFVFGALTLLFILLSVGNFAESELIITYAGYVGILTGLLAMYAAVAQVLNGMYGRTLFAV